MLRLDREIIDFSARTNVVVDARRRRVSSRVCAPSSRGKRENVANTVNDY